jgi:hypothetical protein
MDPLSFLLIALLVLSLVGNIRAWLGRGGGRIKLPGGWVNLTRRQIWEIFHREMTAEESAALHAALQRSDTTTAEAIMAEVTIRYLQRP